ncbi:hypothetical protein [Deinococcus hohokamensis]|uniref:Yip1 domain-containing protein n=1 Tax=Deinococcus hohokamensis TaxID=309883 RepID=A0ABV9IBA6_9DEIO
MARQRPGAPASPRRNTGSAARARPAPPPPAPPSALPPAAPLAADLLRSPRDFAQRLSATTPQPWRYLGVVALSGLLSGVAYALLVRPAANLAAQVAGGGPPTVLTHVSNVLGSLFLTALTFAVMWGLGRLGAGRASRSGEVYGASFVVLPPLLLGVIVWILLTPGAAFAPQGLPAGAGAAQVQQAALRAAAHTPAAWGLVLATGVGLLIQLTLASRALRALTGSAPLAWRGTLLPALPALALQILALLPLLGR